MEVLRLEGVSKTYYHMGIPVPAVRNVNLVIKKGDFVSLMGPSGCGKSTLLNLCGVMDYPTKGQILFNGINLKSLNDGGLTQLRRQKIGFVFQSFNLLPSLTTIENVALPLLLDGFPSKKAKEKASTLIELVGLTHRVDHYPQQLSGGEMQRVGIARAVCHQPKLLLADEPTGNLDSNNGVKIIKILQDLNKNLDIAILLATHSDVVAAATQKVLQMYDGEIKKC
ncbi:MAG: ABC transporter ATP-binding protein [Acidobacteriia bacterium]|nr:ABC transporter ATP-binding protein [Terriglobia bacterium]